MGRKYWHFENRITKRKDAREIQLFNKKNIENPKTKLADKWQIPGDRMFPDYLLPLPSSHSRQKTEQKFFSLNLGEPLPGIGGILPKSVSTPLQIDPFWQFFRQNLVIF